MFNAYKINTLQYNPSLCINCGFCTDVCPHAVFGPNGRVVQLTNPKACMECGACQLNCPTRAITVDSGVGCAAAMIQAALTGKKEATCGGDDGSCCGNDVPVGEALKNLPSLVKPESPRQPIRMAGQIAIVGAGKQSSKAASCCGESPSCSCDEKTATPAATRTPSCCG